MQFSFHYPSSLSALSRPAAPGIREPPSSLTIVPLSPPPRSGAERKRRKLPGLFFSRDLPRVFTPGSCRRSISRLARARAVAGLSRHAVNATTPRAICYIKRSKNLHARGRSLVSRAKYFASFLGGEGVRHTRVVNAS